MSDKTKAELEAENEELQKAQASYVCPNCGFNRGEHERLLAEQDNAARNSWAGTN